MRGPFIPLLLTTIVVIGLIFLLPNDVKPDSDRGDLLVYCAAGSKPPVEEAANAFSEEFGVTVQLNYGGSGTLLSNLKVTNQGDIYIAADSSYTDLAREAGIVQKALPVAKQTPVIAVPKGNPKGVSGIADLLEQDLRIAFANPDAASIGRTTKKLLEQQGTWAAVNELISKHGVFKPTVTYVASDVKLGTVDAGIIWDANAAQFPELEIIPIEGSDAFTQNVTIGILKNSKQPTLALEFAHYLSAPEKGIPIFEKHGFEKLVVDVTP